MMKVTIEGDGGRTVLKVEGKLSGPWVRELEECWQSTIGMPDIESIQVDLTAVTFVDEAGKELLARMHQARVSLAAGGCLTKAVLEEISAAPSPRAPHSKTGLLLAILALLLGAANLRAQEKPTIRLTLHDAVQLALRQNPQVQIAAINLAESEQDRAIARSSLLPQASLLVSDQAVRANIEANIGRRIIFIPEHTGPFQVFQAGTGFSMPVFDLALLRRWQASRHSVEASSADRQSVREQIVLLVVSQYLTSLREMADVRAATSRVELAQALFDQASDLQKHGVATGVDTLRANVELQNESQRLIVAQTQLKAALYGLSRLLNLDPRASIELGDELSFFQAPEFSASQSIERALQNRPEMKDLEARRRSLRAEELAVRESRLPAIHFGGNWTQQGLSATTVIPTYLYQVTVAMPLFTSGRIHAEIIKANQELEKIAQEKQDLRNQIALEAKTAIADLESARHEVDVANLGVKLAETEVSLARDRFQAGVANNLEVITAQDEWARANDNQIAALYRYNQARADLARATGQIESLYAK